MKPVLLIAGGVLGLLIASRLLRRKRSGPVRRARKEVQRAVGDIESAIEGLASRAKKLRGEAKETVEVQVRALESRREDLVERLTTMGAQTKKAARKAKEAAAATPVESAAG